MEFRINPEGNVKLRGRQLSDHDPRRKQRQTHSSDGFPWLPVLYSLGGSEQIPISKRMTVDLTLCPLVNVFPASAPTLCFFGRCCGGWAQIPAGAPHPSSCPHLQRTSPGGQASSHPGGEAPFPDAYSQCGICMGIQKANLLAWKGQRDKCAVF